MGTWPEENVRWRSSKEVQRRMESTNDVGEKVEETDIKKIVGICVVGDSDIELIE